MKIILGGRRTTMGVNTNLYISPVWEAAHIAYAYSLAMGYDPELVLNERNIYSSRAYIQSYGSMPATFWSLRVPNAGNDIILHLNHSPLGSQCWMLSARSTPGNIAVLRIIAQSLGGLLIWQDSDDTGKLYTKRGEDLASWTQLCEYAFATPTASITADDKARAAYN